MSHFNSVELSFRTIKNLLYKYLFSSFEELKDNVSRIIDDMKIQKTYLFNYKETLFEYKKYIENHKDFKFKE